MKFYILVLFFTSELFCQGWVLKITGTSNDLTDVYFIDANTGWTVGQSGTILKTTNGGDNWTVQVSGTAEQLNSVRFVNSTTGYVSGNTGTIRKTTNGGDNWVAQTSGTTEHLFDMSFADASTVYIAKNPSLSSFIIKTSNGGVNWVNVPGPAAATTSAFFLNAATGYVTGLSSPSISYTTNGGGNWITQTNPAAGLISIHFPVSGTGYACGGSSAGVRTTDGGTTWSAMTFPVSGTYRSVFFTSAATGYIAGQLGTGSSPLIMKTTNSGANWVDQPTGQAQYLNSIFFPNTSTGFACGRVGLMIKTTTGGTTGVKIINGIAESFLLEQNYPNPFNPATTIRFSIPRAGTQYTRLRNGQVEPVQLIIFDILGREVSTIVNEQLQPGTYEVDFDASHLTSGVYYYRLSAGSFTETKKIILLR